MPHIVLENANNIKEAFEAVSPFAQKIEGGILKVTDKYINGSEHTALVESLAVEQGVNQNFFIQLSQKNKPHCPTASTHRPRKNQRGQNHYGDDRQTDQRYQ